MRVNYETPFWVHQTFYDSPREDCSGFYEELDFYETEEECRKEYEEIKELQKGEPVAVSSSLDEMDMKEWNKYLEYLNEWAKSHSSIEFYGMSPACFDEWCDNEAEED